MVLRSLLGNEENYERKRNHVVQILRPERFPRDPFPQAIERGNDRPQRVARRAVVALEPPPSAVLLRAVDGGAAVVVDVVSAEASPLQVAQAVAQLHPDHHLCGGEGISRGLVADDEVPVVLVEAGGVGQLHSEPDLVAPAGRQHVHLFQPQPVRTGGGGAEPVAVLLPSAVKVGRLIVATQDPGPEQASGGEVVAEDGERGWGQGRFDVVHTPLDEKATL